MSNQRELNIWNVKKKKILEKNKLLKIWEYSFWYQIAGWINFVFHHHVVGSMQTEIYFYCFHFHFPPYASLGLQ